VKQDHTVSFEGLTLQIPPSSKWASIAKQKVAVLQLQDGSLEVWYKQQKVLSLSQQKVQEIMKKYKMTKTQSSPAVWDMFRVAHVFVPLLEAA